MVAGMVAGMVIGTWDRVRTLSSPFAGLVERFRTLESRYPELSRFARFGAVGASGVVVDAAATHLAGQSMRPNLAFAIGIATAMTWNFFWNRRVTFADAVPSPFWRQYLGFCASCSLGALISWGTRLLLHRQFSVFEDHLVLAVPFGVVAGMMFNYLLCRRWVFRTTRRDEESSSHESNTPPR